MPNFRLPMPGRGHRPSGQMIGARPTPQDKIVSAGQKFGYPGIKNQQGSSRVIYHFLPFDGRTLFEFFKDVSNSGGFPFANISENKLQVAEAMVVQRMYLAIITTDVVTGDVLASMELNQAGLSNIYRSDLNFMIANSQVLKPINVQSFQPQFNWASNWGTMATAGASPFAQTLVGNAVFHADTLINIPPQIEFQFNLKTDGYVAVSNQFLGLTIEGVGAIMSPRQTF